MRRALSGVHQHHAAVFVNQADNILHRIDPADDVGDMGDGRKFRALRDDFFNGLFRIASVHLTVQENQLCAGDAGCHLPGKQVAVMGINAHQKLISLFQII